MSNSEFIYFCYRNSGNNDTMFLEERIISLIASFVFILIISLAMANKQIFNLTVYIDFTNYFMSFAMFGYFIPAFRPPYGVIHKRIALLFSGTPFLDAMLLVVKEETERLDSLDLEDLEVPSWALHTAGIDIMNFLSTSTMTTLEIWMDLKRRKEHNEFISAMMDLLFV
ncbi:hypothetical protein ACJX0J_026871, partial [Zea mays]